MRILYYELRKIWRLPIVLAIVVLGILIYSGFLHGDIYGSHLRMPSTAAYCRISREWAEKYGTHMDEKEALDAQAVCAELRRNADEQIAAYPPLASRGITDLNAFYGFYCNEHSEEAQTLKNDFLERSNGVCILVWETETLLKNYTDWYAYYNDGGGYAQWLTPAETARYDEVIGRRHLNGISCIRKSDFDAYLAGAAVFAVLSVTLLLMPCGAREHLNHMLAEQWPTYTGRNVIRYQLTAALLSAVGLFMLEAFTLGGIYLASQTKIFWGNPMTSFVSGDILWFELTCGGYMLVCLSMTFLLMLGTAGTVFLLSHFSNSYINVILKSGIFVFLYATAGGAAMISALTLENSLYQHVRVIGIEVILTSALCILGFLAGMFPLICRRKELLE